MKLTLANQVRLWSAAACQLIGLILVLTIPTPDGSQTIYTSTQNGFVNEGFACTFLVAAAVLAGISLYRLFRPAIVRPPYAQPFTDPNVNPYSGQPTPPKPPAASSSGPIQH